MLTQERLKELLSYDPDTGVFTNRVQRTGPGKKWSVAGSKTKEGYISIQIDGKKYQAHRLAWIYVYGNITEKSIDHANETKEDNRIVNLRMATRQENGQNISSRQINNTSGFRGVSWNKSSKKWVSQIVIKRKKKHLGYFNTAEEASEVYLKAKRKFHTFWVEDKI